MSLFLTSIDNISMGIHGCLGSVTLYWALADKNEIENSNFINFQFEFLFFKFPF